MVDPRDQSNAEWLKNYNGVSASDTENRAQAVGQRKADQTVDEKISKAPKIEPPSDLNVLIPEGEYTANCYDFGFKEYWGDSKLTLKFEITKGRFQGTRLECYFNLDREKNSDGEYILAPKKGRAYVRLMQQMFQDILESSGDWLTPDNLVGKLFKVQVKTVTRNYAKENLGCCQYSKISPNFQLIKE